MPLSDSKLKKADLQPTVDKVISKFAGWKIGWITTIGRVTLVRAVLSAMPTYQMMVITNPKWLEKVINRIRRSFLWTGKSTASGSKCLVRWTAVCRPSIYSGLGISNLLFQSRALRVRWLWQQFTQPDKPWQGLPIPTDDTVKALFVASTEITVGDGQTSLFWHTHWLQGMILKEAFPLLFKHSRKLKQTVCMALSNPGWIQCIKPHPPPVVLTEFVQLAALLHEV